MRVNLILSQPPDGSGSGNEPPSNPRRTHDQPPRRAILCAARGFSHTTHTHPHTNLGEEPPATAQRLTVRHRCSSSEDISEFRNIGKLGREETNRKTLFNKSTKERQGFFLTFFATLQHIVIFRFKYDTEEYQFLHAGSWFTNNAIFSIY